MISTHNNRIFGLDVVRALAISLVVISHITFLLPEFNSTLTNGIRLLGATGVDIFFVLSGYLIGGILLNQIELHKRGFKYLIYFWKRRWLRTLPNYFVVLLLNILVVVFVYNEKLDVEIERYFLFIQNMTSAHPDFFTEAWSLSIEEYAYLILPFLFYLVFHIFKSANPVRIFVLVTCALLLVLFFFKLKFYLKYEMSDWKSWTYTYRKVVIYRLDSIYMGFLLVYLYRRFTIFFNDYRKTLCAVSVVLFIMLHLAIVSFNITPKLYPFFYTMVYLPLIILSIAGCFPWFISMTDNRINRRFIEFISLRSYSIYLVNYSIVLLTVKRYLEPSILAVLVYLFFTLVLSGILYSFVEIPFLKYRRSLKKTD